MREWDAGVLTALLEVLVVVGCGGREGREWVRGRGGYAVVRECHVGVGEGKDGNGDRDGDGMEGVREVAERVVQVLMRGEEGEEGEEGVMMMEGGKGNGDGVGDGVNEDEDEKIVEIF